MTKAIKYVLVLLILIVSISVNGQRYLVGFRVGITTNRLSNDLSGRVDEENRKMLGYSLNLPVRYLLNKKVSIECGLSYIERNSGTYRTGIYKGIYQKSGNRYIELPLKGIFKIYEISKIKFQVYGGGYFAYWLASKVEGAIPNILDSETGNENSQGEQLLNLTGYNYNLSFSTVRAKRFEAGNYAGIETYWNISTKKGLIIDFEHYRSLVNQQKTDLNQTSRRNSGFVISLGIMQRL